MTTDYDVSLASALKKGLVDAFSHAPTRKGRVRTEATLSGLLNGYREANPGANNLEAHADGGQNIHVEENHPEFARCAPFGRPSGTCDLSVRGGTKPMHVESEFGGARRRKKDVRRVCECPSTENAVFVYRATSAQERGRNDDDYGKMIKSGRTLTVAEVYQRDADTLDKATVTVKAFRGGTEIFRSG